MQKERDTAHKERDEAKTEVVMLRQEARMWRRCALSTGGMVVLGAGAVVRAVIAGWVVVDFNSLCGTTSEVLASTLASLIGVITRLRSLLRRRKTATCACGCAQLHLLPDLTEQVLDSSQALLCYSLHLPASTAASISQYRTDTCQ